MRGSVVLVIALAVAACYSPSPVEGEPCSETNRCPSGLACDLASLTCVSETPEALRLVAIDAGDDFTCGIDPAGAMWCWGKNEVGSLGVGTSTPEMVPVPLAGAHDWTSISAGQQSACGTRADGSMWCWGNGWLHGLGNTDIPERVVEPDLTWSQASLGDDSFCAIATGGALYCRSPSDVDSPLVPGPALPGGAAPAQIAAAGGHACAIDTAGRLYCWGNNDRGQVGDGSIDPVVPDPTEILPGTTWKTVASGTDTVCAIATDDALWCWGDCNNNQTGQGLGPASGCPTPVRVGTDTYRSVEPGVETTCAVRSDGAMVCFGANDHGQLGDVGGKEVHEGLTVMRGIDGFEHVTSGYQHSCGLRAGGEAWCWGDNSDGQLGDGGGGNTHEPVQVHPGPWQTIATGAGATCGIASDGSLWCWGKNHSGQIGDGTTYQRHRPAQIGADHDWTAVAIGRAFACGIRGGGLYCWGDNADDQLGLPDTRGELRPRQVGADRDWTAIAAGELWTCGLRGGQLYCWGENIDEEPALFDDATSWTAISMFAEGNGVLGFEICAIKDAGRLFCFNSGGVPSVPTDTAFQAWGTFALGWGHGCGLDGATARCLGVNTAGELGLGTMTAEESTGMPVTGGDTWSVIDAGDAASCGVTVAGALNCWGYLDLNGLGGEDTVATPTEVVPGTTWTTADVGLDHACAIAGDGALWCWGENDFGERGDGLGGSDRAVRVRAPAP